MCKTNEAYRHEYLGLLPCDGCRARQGEYTSPNEPVEITTKEIKNAREQYADDIEQPFREGVLNKRYVEAHGTSRIQVTKQDLKNMKDVYSENHYYKK